MNKIDLTDCNDQTKQLPYWSCNLCCVRSQCLLKEKWAM